MQPLPQFSFSGEVGRLLSPWSRKAKRIGLLKIAHRVQGKIVELESGSRVIIIEQRGRDTWRGRARSIDEARECETAHLGVDTSLLRRAENHGVTLVMIVVADQRRVFLTPLRNFFEAPGAISRVNFQGRTHKLLPYDFFHQRHIAPRLHESRKRVTSV